MGIYVQSYGRRYMGPNTKMFAEKIARGATELGIGIIELLPLIASIISMFKNFCPGPTPEPVEQQRRIQAAHRPRKAERGEFPYTKQVERGAIARVEAAASREGQTLDDTQKRVLALRNLEGMRTASKTEFAAVRAELDAQGFSTGPNCPESIDDFDENEDAADK